MSRFTTLMQNEHNKLASEKSKEAPKKLTDEELALKKMKQDSKFIQRKPTMLR